MAHLAPPVPTPMSGGGDIAATRHVLTAPHTLVRYRICTHYTHALCAMSYTVPLQTVVFYRSVI